MPLTHKQGGKNKGNT